MAKELKPTPNQHTMPATAPSSADAASRLKHELLADKVERMLGRDDTKPSASGPAHVLLALANHGDSPAWDQWKLRQRQMYEAAPGMKLKLGFYGSDDESGVRRLNVSTHWIGDADVMDGHLGRAQTRCACGCFVNACAVFEQAVQENAKQRMRAVILTGDVFHDNQKSLDGAALAVNQLRREGTRVFLIQQGNNPDTARKLQYLARVAGATYFQLDEQDQHQYVELLNAVARFASGGEAAVKARGGQAATLLLEHLKQQPMPMIEQPESISVNRK